ncbi:MAG: DMT family transporter [Rubellimicrobium sp.]|nr:DMT family transporter [Rubellimicrobium sp.]
MILTGLLFVWVTAIVKHVGDAVPAAQSAFLRYALAIPFLIPMIGPILAAGLSRRQIGLFGLRGLVHSAGVIFWFYAMTRIPLAEVTAMGYLTPVLVTIGAALVLGEGFALRRLTAIAAAFAGALIVLRPGLREIDPGHLAMLGTAVMFAVGYLVAKQLSGEVSATVIVGMLSITVTIGLLPAALAVWVPPTPAVLGWFFLTAVFATAGHYTMTFAFAAAPLTVTQPVTFLQLLWAVIMGAVFFAEPVDIWVIAGGSLILAAVSFITWREATLKRRITPAVAETK